MNKNIKQYGNNNTIIKKLQGKTIFLCTIATTETSTTPGITAAGATPELTLYTPALDAELLVRNEPVSAPEIPQTELGGTTCLTPGIITKGALELTNTPFVVANAGSQIIPQIPHITINTTPGKNINTGKAVNQPEEIYKKAKILGQQLSQTLDYIILAESLPAGTTTALGTLTALGYDAKNKVSGSAPENPHQLKNQLVETGLKKAKITPGKCTPYEAVAAVGDPMLIATAGIILGSTKPILLAGGTQLTAALALVKAIKPDYNFTNICQATTPYVVNDETSNILNITQQINPDITIFSADPEFEKSENPGLQVYTKGSVKEGVGAGGAIFLALLQGATTQEIRKNIEKLA